MRNYDYYYIIIHFYGDKLTPFIQSHNLTQLKSHNRNLLEMENDDEIEQKNTYRINNSMIMIYT